MARRGPKPRHHLGEGVITRKGYHRIRRNGRQVMAHRWIWEQHHGKPVPDGSQIHHRNGDKLDNRIENLECVGAVRHKRLHSGCRWDGEQWHKPCGKCGEFKPVTTDHWYISREGWPQYGRCRPCHIRIVVEAKRLRKMRKARGVDHNGGNTAT